MYVCICTCICVNVCHVYTVCQVYICTYVYLVRVNLNIILFVGSNGDDSVSGWRIYADPPPPPTGTTCSPATPRIKASFPGSSDISLTRERKMIFLVERIVTFKGKNRDFQPN